MEEQSPSAVSQSSLTSGTLVVVPGIESAAKGKAGPRCKSDVQQMFVYGGVGRAMSTFRKW